MKKKLLIYFAFVIGLLLWGGNVYALTPTGMRLYYDAGQGVHTSTSTTGTNIWAGYNVLYIDQAMGGSLYPDYPEVLYTFFGSYNCTENCQVQGSFVNSVTGGDLSQPPYGYTVQIETNGRYATCVVNGYSYVQYYEKIDFTCNTDSLANGFNIVSSNMSYYTDRYTYYGIAYDTIQIQSLLGTQGIITNNNQNTQNIINNNNNNTQSIINNNNQNVGAIINNENQNTQNIINNINDNTTQSEQELTGFLATWNSFLPTNGVVSSLFLLPVNFLNAFIGNFNNTCQPFNLGSLYGHNITFPCIDIQSIVGSNLYMAIDLLFCGLMIFAMIKKLILIWYEITSFKANAIYELYGGGK